MGKLLQENGRALLQENTGFILITRDSFKSLLESIGITSAYSRVISFLRILNEYITVIGGILKRLYRSITSLILIVDTKYRLRFKTLIESIDLTGLLGKFRFGKVLLESIGFGWSKVKLVLNGIQVGLWEKIPRLVNGVWVKKTRIAGEWISIARINGSWNMLSRVTGAWTQVQRINGVWGTIDRITGSWTKIDRITDEWDGVARVQGLWSSIERKDGVWDNVPKVVGIWSPIAKIKDIWNKISRDNN